MGYSIHDKYGSDTPITTLRFYNSLSGFQCDSLTVSVISVCSSECSRRVLPGVLWIWSTSFGHSSSPSGYRTPSREYHLFRRTFLQPSPWVDAHTSLLSFKSERLLVPCFDPSSPYSLRSHLTPRNCRYDYVHGKVDFQS